MEYRIVRKENQQKEMNEQTDNQREFRFIKLIYISKNIKIIIKII